MQLHACTCTAGRYHASLLSLVLHVYLSRLIGRMSRLPPLGTTQNSARNNCYRNRKECAQPYSRISPRAKYYHGIMTNSHQRFPAQSYLELQLGRFFGNSSKRVPSPPPPPPPLPSLRLRAHTYVTGRCNSGLLVSLSFSTRRTVVSIAPPLNIYICICMYIY